MSTQRVFLYVQHLLGIGHVQRACLLAKALTDMGLEVHVANGGMPVPNLDWGKAQVHQLAPIRSRDQDFSALVDAHDRVIDEAWKNHRRDQLLAHFQHCQPHALIVETFPFGRRQMRFELLPLLQLAHATQPKPCVISSIRDILQEKPRRIQETLGLIQQYFDRILVHGDPRFVTLSESFSPAKDISAKLHYTGFISKPIAAYKAQKGAGEVILSTGGGAVGQRLLLTAMATRSLSKLADHPWRLLMGTNPNQIQWSTLQQQAPAGMIIEPARPDFPSLLASCTVSISQAGYNTVMDILRAKARAVLVPFRGSKETEQTLRAARLKAQGRVQVVEENELTPRNLAKAVDAALMTPPLQPIDLDLEGGANSAQLIAEWLSDRNNGVIASIQ